MRSLQPMPFRSVRTRTLRKAWFGIGIGVFLAGLSGEPPTPKPHPKALPNTHATGEVDRVEMVPYVVKDSGALAGIVVDETAADLAGVWRYSTHTPPYVGLGYIHTEKGTPGAKSATFTPDLPAAGLYEVRLSHCYNVRRTAKALVTVRHEAGETQLRINQQQEPEHHRLFRTLGRFRFAAGQSGWVRISNDGVEEGKVVIADAVQWIPIKE